MSEKTPWNPSRKATARVKDVLPTPEVCPHCTGKVGIVKNDVIYGRLYGKWPWVYRCENEACDSYVGMHPFTNIPLGTLANAATREARKQAKGAFNSLWQRRGMDRSQGYNWLASCLNIPWSECHFGWFDIAMCQRVIEVCKKAAAGTA